MIHEAQGTYFQLLGSLLYNEPSIDTMKMLTDDNLFNELPCDFDNELVRTGREQISSWLKSADNKTLTGDARADYVRILVGIDGMLASPWGSMYLNEDGLLFNEETLMVRQFYERHGIMIEKKHQEPDDHIGLELNFVAQLLNNGNTGTAKSFAVQYMKPWVFSWNNDIQKHARTGYYTGLANMAIGGVKELCRQ